MIETIPDIGTRVEQSLTRIFKDAFPNIAIRSFSEPGERDEKSLGVRCDVGPEEPIGTNMFDTLVEIEARNFDEGDRQILHGMIGNTSSARETIEAYSAKQFAMPRGQAITMNGAPRTVEDQKERIVTYSLTATIQPL